MARKRKAKPAKPARRPQVEVDEEVDLHGLAVDEALAQVELALARHRSGDTLRLIHGSSSGSNPWSIRSAVRRHLDSVWRNRVSAHRMDPGNPGATLVLLGRPPKPA